MRGQAAFDHRVLASVCFFATDIHSATLGKGQNDDSLIRVRRGDLTGKGELVVCYRHPGVREMDPHAAGQMIFGKQDTHVPREGRDLIRKELEDARVIVSVGSRPDPRSVECSENKRAVFGGASATRVYSGRVVQGPLGRRPHTIAVLVHDGGV